MSIVQGTLPVGSLDHAITLNVQSSGGSHFETVTDTTPYLHRASPQDVASSMKLKKVVGGTIAWNQIGGRTKFPTTHGENGISISWTDAETVSISGTASSVSWINVSVTNEITADNHIYLVTATNKPSDLRFGVLVHDGSFSFQGDGTAPYYLFKNTTGWKSINIRHLNGVQYDYQTKFQVYDLTQMFGSSIADYIYSLEQAHAGDGVAWFKALFPKAYYSYNAGELMSVQTSAHKTVGFNQWDEEWENGFYSRDTGAKAGNSNTTYYRSKNYIPCFPSTAYYIKVPSVHASNNTFCGICYYDASKNFISATTKGSSVIFTTPSDVYYMTFYIEVGTSGASYQNDICISLSSSRNGEYEPYEEHTYPLDDNLTLRGIPKLDGNNDLYYDGDTYASDGTVTRRYGVVDLGTLNWSYSGSSFNISLAGIEPPSWVRNGNEWGICQKYIIESWSSIDFGTLTDKSLHGLVYNGYLMLRLYDSSYTDASTFISAMNGVYLVYEMTTPTTESADPYTQSQRVGATEEFVDGRTVEIPVGNVSEYKRLIQED